MYYVVQSSKSLEQAAADLEAAVVRHGFSVLHVHDLGAKIRSKGVEFGPDCKIFEVCNPVQASKVLSADLRLNMALPCRISVFADESGTKIGMIRPVPMLSALSDDKSLLKVAEEVEAKTTMMIDEAK